jgi:hypothetical protein
MFSNTPSNMIDILNDLIEYYTIDNGAHVYCQLIKLPHDNEKIREYLLSLKENLRPSIEFYLKLDQIVMSERVTKAELLSVVDLNWLYGFGALNFLETEEDLTESRILKIISDIEYCYKYQIFFFKTLDSVV